MLSFQHYLLEYKKKKKKKKDSKVLLYFINIVKYFYQSRDSQQQYPHQKNPNKLLASKYILFLLWIVYG